MERMYQVHSVKMLAYYVGKSFVKTPHIATINIRIAFMSFL